MEPESRPKFESSEDMQRWFANHIAEQKRTELEANKETIRSFKEFCKTKGIILSDENFDYEQTIGIVAKYPNIVEILQPTLEKDKEGLYNFNTLCELYKRELFNPGYLFAENYMLMAHPYFRRGYYSGNNFAPHFVDRFWNFRKAGNQTGIAIDQDRVRINVDNSAYKEFDTWYGAKFQRDIYSIKDGPTKLKPPPLSDFHNSFLFGDAFSLDILWESNSRIKEFQAEEFKTENIKIRVDGEEFYPVRYIHAEFDLTTGAFTHFDGAMHLYTETEYFARRDSDFNYMNKTSHQIKGKSVKLFKFNDPLQTNEWTELVGHFFSGNPLTFEYFEEKYPDGITEILSVI